MGEKPRAVAVLVALLAPAVVFGYLQGSHPPAGDVWLFASAGSTLLSGRWLHAFHNPGIQAGPLELAFCALARRIGASERGFAIALDLGAWAVVATSVWALLRARPAPCALFGLAACAALLPGEGYRGHPAELVIGALWLLAARGARAGRTTLAAALVGLSACFELFGLLGLALLVLAPPRASRIRPLLLCLAIPVLCFLPFAAGGDFHMFAYAWTAARPPATLLVGTGGHVTWPLRLAEAALILAAGSLAAWRLRGLPESVWLIPALLVLTRVALDPVSYGYYYDPALVALFLGAAQLASDPGALAGRLAARLETRSPPGEERGLLRPTVRRERRPDGASPAGGVASRRS